MKGLPNLDFRFQEVLRKKEAYKAALMAAGFELESNFNKEKTVVFVSIRKNEQWPERPEWVVSFESYENAAKTLLRVEG